MRTTATSAAHQSRGREGGATTLPAVNISGATVRLTGRVIFADVDLTVGGGEFVAVLGPNGAGKSTLMRAILGLVAPCRRIVAVLGASPASARPSVGTCRSAAPWIGRRACGGSTWYASASTAPAGDSRCRRS